MNLTLSIIVAMLVLSILAPFIALRAASSIKKTGYKPHVKIQKRLFWACVLGVVILELQIRVAGGSGSLVANGTYASAPFFKPTLAAHIVGAVATYTIWSLQLFLAGRKIEALGRFPRNFAVVHKRLGYATIAGLFYTAITATIVCASAFWL